MNRGKLKFIQPLILFVAMSLMACGDAGVQGLMGDKKEKTSFPMTYTGTYTVTAGTIRLNLAGGYAMWDCARTSTTTEVTLVLEKGGTARFDAPRDYITGSSGNRYDHGWWLYQCDWFNNPASMFSDGKETFVGSHDSAGSLRIDKTQWACGNPAYTVSGTFTKQNAEFKGGNGCVISDFVNGVEAFRRTDTIDVSFTGTIVQ